MDPFDHDPKSDLHDEFNQSHQDGFAKAESIRATMVVGGSGFIGRNLVRHFSDQQESVVSIYHRRLPEPLPNVYPVCSDLNSVDLLAAPLRGVDTVYYLAWDHNFLAPQDPLVFKPELESCSYNLKILRNLLEAMEIASTRRLIFLSAVGTNRKAQSGFLKEKYLAEFAILNSKIPEKVILRSSLVYTDHGENDRFIQSIMNLMKYPLYPVPAHTEPLAPIHVDDLIEILFQLSSCDLQDSASILEVTGQEFLKIEDLFRLVSDKFLKGTRFQLRGSLGNTLVPVFERKSKKKASSALSIRDFLALGSHIDANTTTDNPLRSILPSQYRKLTDTLGRSVAAKRS